MDDLISRQAATSIPILPKEHRKIFKSIDDAFETGWNEALSCVNMLPSTQPECKKGEWIFKDHLWECNQCGCRCNRANPLSGNIWNYYYCPNCGADMRGKQDG